MVSELTLTVAHTVLFAHTVQCAGICACGPALDMRTCTKRRHVYGHLSIYACVASYMGKLGLRGCVCDILAIWVSWADRDIESFEKGVCDILIQLG
jgi:hypothetical protein